MYKTHSAIILNRFETLNNRLLSTIANARRRAPASVPLLGSGSAGAGTPALEGDDPMAGSGAASPAPGTPKPAAAGGGGKKKKKKGKR